MMYIYVAIYVACVYVYVAIYVACVYVYVLQGSMLVLVITHYSSLSHAGQ